MFKFMLNEVGGYFKLCIIVHKQDEDSYKTIRLSECLTIKGALAKSL